MYDNKTFTTVAAIIRSEYNTDNNNILSFYCLVLKIANDMIIYNDSYMNGTLNSRTKRSTKRGRKEVKNDYRDCCTSNDCN